MYVCMYIIFNPDKFIKINMLRIYNITGSMLSILHAVANLPLVYSSYRVAAIIIITF